MYQLTEEKDERRKYKSTNTGTEIFTRLIYTDTDKNNWWAFENLMDIPFIRKQAAEKITQLYGAGMNEFDINDFISNSKALLKSNDPEKYEKLYSELLNFERLKEQTANPVKQNLGLCTVYILKNDEVPDVWNSSAAAEKMSAWAIDLKAQGFFLNWFTDGIKTFTRHLEDLSQIVSIADQLQATNTEA